MCNYVAYNRFYKRRFFTFILLLFSSFDGGLSVGVNSESATLRLVFGCVLCTSASSHQKYIRARQTESNIVQHFILLFNERSVTGKFTAIQQWIKDTKLSLAALVDTWHDDASSPQLIAFALPGFRYVESTRPRNNLSIRRQFAAAFACSTARRCMLALFNYSSSHTVWFIPLADERGVCR